MVYVFLSVVMDSSLEIKLVMLVLVTHLDVFHAKFKLGIAAVGNLQSAGLILLLLSQLRLPLPLPHLHLHHLTLPTEVVQELAH